jgi:hypothetical protein
MPSIPGQARLGPTGRRNRTSLKPLYELLENRTLMSRPSVSSSASSSPSSFFSSLLGAATGTSPSAQVPLVPGVISSELPKNVSGRIEALYELSLTTHPLYQSIKDGRVSKAPMFYSKYTGPKHLDLDVYGAIARISPHQDFLLTGKVLGPIDASQPAFFSFLINRGGASSPGPVPDRRAITFDSTVTVTTGPGGIVGTVSLNSRGNATSTVTLPASDVQVAGNSVNVTVAASLLPSTSPPGTHQAATRYSDTFIAGVPGGSASDIAGFVPEYTTTMVDASTFRNQ